MEQLSAIISCWLIPLVAMVIGAIWFIGSWFGLWEGPFSGN